MARYVKVATVGLAQWNVNAVPENKTCEEFMADAIERNLAGVLWDKPDLIVLPEYCDRMIGMPEDEYGTRLDETAVVFQRLRKIAQENRCYITYPTRIRKEDGSARNSCVMIDRNGGINGIYDKNFLVMDETFGGKVLCGEDMTVFECDFGRVGAVICFDLNFEENRKRLKEANVDLVVFMSMYHGGIAQNFFAYDTRSYFVSALAGSVVKSTIVSPVGETIRETTNYHNYLTESINLDFELVHLDGNWSKINAAKEKYGRKIKVYDPGLLGSVMISSETDEFMIDKIVDEFGLEKLDDYFTRAREHRAAYTGK